MITMKISNESIKIFNEMQDVPKRVQKSVEKELDSIGLDIMANIKRKMRDTKRQSKSTGKNGHKASVAGAPPAIDTGRLVGSFEMVRVGGFLEVGTNVEYAKYLQGGTGPNPKLNARPFLEPGVEDIDFSGRIKDAIMRGFRG